MFFYASGEDVADEALKEALDGNLTEDDALEALLEVAEMNGVSEGEINRVFSELGVRANLPKTAGVRTAGVVDWALSKFRGNKAMLKAVMALALAVGNGLYGYSVKKGDSLWKISGGKPSVMKQIMELNNLDANAVLRVGQEIVLPDEVQPKETPSGNGGDGDAKSDSKVHVVID